MMKYKSILTVIEDTISAMRYTGSVLSVATSGSNWIITTIDNTKLVVNEYVTIGSVRYKVLSKTDYRTFTVSGASQPNGSTWTCEAPYFYHGTPIDANNEHNNDLLNNSLKYPFICLFEPIEYDFNAAPSQYMQTVNNLWLIFMTDADTSTWTASDYHTYAIDDMGVLMNRFFYELYKQEGVVHDEQPTMNCIEHLKYGLVARTKGTDKYLFNDNLSGIECSNVKVQLIKEYEC